MARQLLEKVRECFLEAACGDLPVPEAAKQALWRSLNDSPCPKDLSSRKEEIIGSPSRQMVEDGLRRLLMDLCEKANDEGRDLLLPESKKLLDIALWLAGNKFLEPGLPCTLLEDLVEICANPAEFQDVFAWIDREKYVLNQLHIFQRGKLILLRSFNKALRHIAGGANSVLAGKILFCMAHLWPLIERSAVNHVGQHNPFSTINISLEQTGEAIYDARGIPVNRELYVKFWSIIQSFKDTTSSRTVSLLRDIRAVLGLLNSQPLKYKSTKGGLGVGGEHALLYNADPDLFRMQLQDFGFRVHFLLEILIYLHRLEHPGKGPSAANELTTPELVHEVQVTKDEVMCYITTMGTDGPNLTKTIEKQLKREDQWVKWKSAGCKDWTLPPPEPENSAEAERPGKAGEPDEVNAEDLVWRSRRKLRKTTKRYCRALVEDQYLAGKGGDFIPSLETMEEQYSYPVVKDFVKPILDGDFSSPPKTAHSCLYGWRVYRLMTSENHFSMDSTAPLDIEKFVNQAFSPPVGPGNGHSKSSQKTPKPQGGKGVKRKDRDEIPEDQLTVKAEPSAARSGPIDGGKGIEGFNVLDEES